jgi:hypothetical protein
MRRRDLLAALAGSSLAGCGMLPSSDEGDGSAPTARVSDDRARELAEQFAPTVYFDADETWFPTDPRPYATERDGERVVPGFDAVEGYLEQFTDADGPPDPTVFYNAVRYEDSSLAVVQFWLYSAFDQFTVNFHWHDWEVLHVWLDTDSDDAQFYVASSHSSKVPNNEFLDPESRPRILSELGSHSSAMSLNDRVDSFQRFPDGDTFADVTNASLDLVESLGELPVAYGLPRDEGSRLPYAIPELDGDPIYDHPDLPSFERSHLVPDDLTVRSFDALDSPPTDLPERRTGTEFAFDDGDVTYDLVPTTEVEDISSFTGPQLSFEFAVPEFAEDAVASHITSTGTPWKQDRYLDPVADVTDPRHRSELADRYDAIDEGGPLATVAGVVDSVVSDDDAPDGEGVTTTDTAVESIALLESDPAVVPSFGGAVVARDVPDGDHRLTVDGPGYAPYSERVAVDGSAAAGVDGRVRLVENRDATKLRVDADAADEDLRAFAVEDDFGGRLYETTLDGRDAVYVHRGGAYTAEVRDAEDRPGAFRVNPDPSSHAAVTIDRPRTGKTPLAHYLADLAGETADRVAAEADGGGNGGQNGGGGGGDGVTGLVRALEAVREAAVAAAERAEASDAPGADQQLQAVRTRLSRVSERLADASGDLPPAVGRAVDNRLGQANRRAEQALDVEKT